MTFAHFSQVFLVINLIFIRMLLIINSSYWIRHTLPDWVEMHLS